ncbi:MAG TPA: hypothetical protein VJS92_03285 [Candidatus Polarisedimenticolaceae bacterium]|nr:hypothetical protein [Candidatus Polarisedimenticolaceae bacterium]
MRRVRGLHRILGLVLLLPILGWAATGFVFFVKPGYAGAYESLRVRRHPLERPEWLETRTLRTALGDHLLARTESGWTHLDPATLAPLPLPDETGIRRLVEDAIATNRVRYGDVVSVVRDDGSPPSATVRTSTGVEIQLDWSGLELQQSGRDTRRIDGLYRIHYLQWTGVRTLDRVLGAAGLASLLLLAALGVRLAFARGAG